MPRRAVLRRARPSRRRAAVPAPAPAATRPPVRRWWLLATTALLPVTGTALAQAPTGAQVVAGQAAIAQGGNRTTITQRTDRAAIDWQQFNVGSQHTVQFVQPNQGSWTLNRVVGPDPSVIAGRIQANGGVAIVNQSGMVFAGGAQVDVGSLIASAANITNNNFMAGRMVFDGAPRPGARVENRGTITVADRGLAALVGPGVSNSGVIRANLGRVALGAAETFVLDLAGDGLIGIDVTRAVTAAPDGNAALVTNSGVIEANGGSVLITAHAASGLVEDLVRNTGRIEANTVGARTGEVALRADGGGVRQDGTISATGGAGQRGGTVAMQATGQVTVGAAARVDASGGAGGGRVLAGTTGRGRNQTMAARTVVERGAEIRADATQNGRGGEILVNSTDRTEMRGTLSARGGEAGGNGGFIEVSGQSAFVLDGIVDLRAPNGEMGDFLLDPRNIFIADSGVTPPGTVTETPTGLDSVGGSVTGPGAISATTGGDSDWVRITPDIIEGYAAGNIILEASRQIVIGSEVNRTTAGNLTLTAGLSGSSGNITQNAGADISVNGVLTMQTAAGSISLGADLRATGVVLAASGDISQTGGTIAHRTASTDLALTVTASGANADVDLTQAGNGRFVLAASSAGGDFALSGSRIRVAGDLTADAVSLTTTAGPLTLGADVRATSLTLAAAGSISQTSGTIAHSTADTDLALTVTATGAGSAVALNQAGNGRIALNASSAPGSFALSGEAISVDGTLSGGAVSLAATTGALVIDANIRATDLTLRAATGIDQTGGNIQHRANAATALALTASVSGIGDIGLDRTTNGNLRLRDGGTADGDMRVASSRRLEVGSGQTLTVAGALELAVTGDGNPLVLAGSLRAESVSLTAAGDISQTGGSIAHVTAGSELPLTVNASEDGSVDLTSTTNGAIALGASTAAGDFALTGEAIRVTGALAADGTSLTATTGAIALGDDLRATSLALTSVTGITQGGGTIIHRENSNFGLPLTINVTGTGDVVLDGANGNMQIMSGGTADGSVSITSAQHIELIDGQTFSVAGAAALTVSGNDTGNALLLNGSLFADSVTLSATGSITQAAGGVLARRAADGTADLAAALPLTATATGNGHDISLTGANGALRILGATTEDGDMILAGRSLTVAGAVTADRAGAARGDVTLVATGGGMAIEAAVTARNAAIGAAGDVTQTAAFDLGGTGGGRLRLRGPEGGDASVGGSIALTQANSVAELDARASGALAFTAAGDLSVTQAHGAGVTLTGAAITVPTGAAGESGIVATGSGDVAVIADSLDVAGTVSASDGRTISLRVDSLDLTGATVTAGTTGTVEIGPRTAGRAVQIGTSGNPTNTTELATADLEAIAAGTLRIGRTTIASEATQTITANGLTVVDAVAPSAALSLVSANGINVNAGITAPSIRMETSAGNIALGAVNVEANGPNAAITLLSAGSIEQSAGGALVSPGGTVVDLIAHAQVTIDLIGSGDFRLAGGITPASASGERSLFAPLGIQFETTGAITVAAAMEVAASSTYTALVGRSIAIEAPILLPGLSALTLTATGGGGESTISQTALGLIRTGHLTLSAEGAIDLSLAANQVGTLGTVSFTEGFGYRSTTGFTVGGALAPSDGGNANITIIADTGDILLQAPISAGSGTVRLNATTGDILQDAAGAAITAGRLELTAGGDALLDPTLAADRNVVGTLGGGTIGGTLRFNAAGDLILDGSLTQTGPGGAVRIAAGGTLTQNAGAVLGFSDITLVAPGAMTLGGTIGVDQANPVSVVRLGTDAGITQGATGRIVAHQLGLRATGDVSLMDGDNDVRQIAAMTGGVFALDTNGALATTLAPIAVERPGGGSADVWGVQGSSVTLSAADLTIHAANLGPYAGFGIGIGAFASAADGVLRLRADNLALNSYLFAGPGLTGRIEIAPRTLSRQVVLGGSEAGALSLPATLINQLYGGSVVIGRSEAGAGALTVAGAVGMPTTVNDVLLQGGGITLDGVFALWTANGTLTLNAVTGDIVQNGGAVIAPTLIARAQNGSVLLDGALALNDVDRLSGSAGAGETFAFSGSGSYIVAGNGIDATGGTVALHAPSGSITQSLGAPIVADRLSANASGLVSLDGGGADADASDLNRVATLGPSSGTSVIFRNAEDLTVEGVTATGPTGSLIVLEAPNLTLAGNILASTLDGRVILRTAADFDAPADGTSIVQTGGIIQARDLSASAGDEIDLGSANQITRLVAGQGVSAGSTNSIVLGAGGTLNLTDGLNGIQVAARVNAGAGGAVRIIADGLTVAPGLSGTVFYAPGGVVRFLPFTAGATIGLGGSGDTTTYATSLLQRVDTGRLVIGSETAGTITLREALNLTGVGAPLALELRSGRDILAGGYTLSLREVSAYAADSVVLGTAGSAIQRIVAGETEADGIRAGGNVTVATGGTLAVDASIRTDGAGITLQAADFAIASGAEVQTGAVPGSRITVRSTNAAGLDLGVSDSEAGLSQAEISRLDARGGTLRLEGTAIDFAGTVAIDAADATLLDLASSGFITQSGGTLAAQSLRADAFSVQIDRAGNSLPQIQATATGDISIATGGATTVLGTSSAFGNAAINAGSITLSDAAGIIAVWAAGTATLTATTGGITGAADLAAVQATTLNATAATTIDLTGNNAVGTLAAIAGTGVTFENTRALTAGATGAGGTAIAGNVRLAAPSLRLNDVLATGTVDLTASAGTIDQAAGARLAAGILRAGATGSVILDGANPDGTARNQIQDIDALSAGADITLRNAIALTLDLPLSVGAGQVLTLEAPTLTIGDNLTAGAGGRIVLRTGSFIGGVASGGDITQTGGTITAPTLAALAGGAVSLDRTGNAIGALGGGTSAARADLGLGLRAGTSAVLRSTGYGGNASLGVTGALDIGPGGSLLLRADDFAIAAAIRVPSGIITLLPYTTGAGIGYVLGGASGSTNAGRITLDSTELSFFPSGTPAAELILGALGVTGSVDIVGDVSLATAGATPRVNRLTLIGDGALTQAAGTRLDVAALRAIFPNGAVLLDPGSAGNRIAALHGVTAGGDVAIRGGAGMMALLDDGSGNAITVNGTGRTVTLRADDLDIQAAVQAPGGVINLLPETAGHGVTLGGTGAGTLALDAAEIARLGAGGATGALRLRIGGDSAGTVTAGNIRIVGDVALRGPGGERASVLDLLAGSAGISGGSVSQTGGTVNVAALTGSAQGDFRVDGANVIDGFGEITAGQQRNGDAAVAADVALRSTGNVTAGGIVATRNLSITAGGTLATGLVTLPGGTPGSLGAAITAGGQASLTAGGALTAGGVTAQDIVLDGGSVTLSGLIQGDGGAARSVRIDSDGALTQQAGALIIAETLTIGSGSISLPEENQILELTGLVATGPVFALNTVLELLVSGAISANGSLSLATDRGLTVADTGSITVTGGPGTALLTAGGAIDFAGTLTTSGAATLTAGGALSFTGTADVGGTLVFGAGAGMTLAGTIGTGGEIEAEAVGALASTAALTAEDGIVLTAGTTLDVGGTWSAGGAATFDAQGLLTYTATGTAGGAATLTTPGAIIATAGSSIDAAGIVRLDAGTTLSAGGTIGGGALVELIAGTGAMTFAGIIDATGDVIATAGAGLTTNGTITAGGDATLTAGGALSASTTINVGGDLTLDAGAALVTTAVLTADGDVSLTADGALSASNRIGAGGTLALDAGTTMDVAGTWSAGGAATFTAGGLVTYTATGTGEAGVTITTTGGIIASAVSSIDGAGTVRLDAGTTLSATGIISGGPLVELIAGSGAMTLAGTIGATGAVTATAGAQLTTTAAITAGGAVTLTADDALSASNSIVATGALTLDAGGAMSIDGVWSAGGATAFTAGGLITYTATGTGGAGVTMTTPGGIIASAASSIEAAGTVRLDAGMALSATGTISGGPLVELIAGSDATLAGTIDASGAFTATAGTGLTTAAAITARGDATLATGGFLSASASIDAGGSLTLEAGGTLATTAILTTDRDATLIADGALSASNRITAAGTLTLDAGAAMNIDGTWSAGGAATFTAGGLVTYTAAGSGGADVIVTTPGGMIAAAGSAIHAAGTVRLDAGTTLSATGTISGGPLVQLIAGSGAMTLAGAIDAAGAITAAAGTGLTTTAAIRAGSDATLTTGGALSASASISAGGNLALNAGGALATTAILTAGSDATLTAGGALSASNRIAAAGALTLGAGAAMDVAGTWSAGGAARFNAGGLVTYTAVGTAGGATTITTRGAISAAAGSVINAGGAIGLDAAADLAAAGTLSGTMIDLRAGSGAMTLAGAITANEAISAAAGGSLTTSALVVAGTDASLVAGGLLDATNRIEAGRDLTLRGAAGLRASGTFAAGRDAVLASAGGPVTIAGTLSAGAAIQLAAGGGLQSAAQVRAGSTLTVTAGGDAALSELHTAGTALAIDAAGSVTGSGAVSAGQAVTIRAGQALALQGSVQAGSDMTLRAGAGMSLGATAIAGGTIDAAAGGDVLQTGTLTGQSLLLAAGGTLAQSGVLQSGEAVSLTAGAALMLSGQTVAASDIIMAAGGVATLADGSITAGREVRLDAGQGLIIRSFQVGTGAIAFQTDGGLLVEGSLLTAGGTIRLGGGSAALRSNTIVADRLGVTADGTLTLDGGRYVIGRAVAFRAPGGISTPSTITVAPRDGVLPAVVFDTRAPGPIDPLEVVEPDIAGVPANQQATQVRIPGTEAPGAFGPASTAAAGPMQIDIDAGRSAIFLLLDGGSATGEIVSAGRLAIHGTGGSAELTGQLVDPAGAPVQGQNAARFADSTRPASTGALTRYRLNGCVVSSINCIVPSQVLAIPQAPPQRVEIGLGGGAITDPDVQLPNVAEEDY